MSPRDLSAGVKFAVTWLHKRADSMNDPHAKAILNSAAFSLGQEGASGRAALQPSGQTRAEIIEECAKVAEAWDGKPCGPASGWTDDQRDYYDAGQLDASSSIVRAIRALAAQGKKP